VLAVIAIARGLKLDLVAEGVESDLQAAYLEQAGCRIMQGYRFHKPMDLAQFGALLRPAASAQRTGAG
jgi:EAL domain-containing protein (putative c-di-GMP-specific phosphodiesterase class I)